MNGLEEAIRKALAKVAEPDAQIRARIYQSARNALENGLQKQGVSDANTIARQRQRLEDIINEIEREERLGQMERDAAADNAKVLEEHAAAKEAMMQEPTGSAAEEDVGLVSPADGPDADGSEWSKAETAETGGSLEGVTPERPQARLSPQGEMPEEAAIIAEARPVIKRKRWRARLFSFIILCCFAGLAYWWAQSSGILKTVEEWDTSVPNPPPRIEDEDFGGEASTSNGPKRGFSSQWLLVFEPTDISRIDVGVDANAEVQGAPGEEYLLVNAPAGGAQSGVGLEIPSTVLEAMAGKVSTVALTVRGREDGSQISVECDFGQDGGCGRQRFVPGAGKSDFLFNVEVPDNTTGVGAFIINVSAGGKDGEADIFSIRVLPEGEPE